MAGEAGTMASDVKPQDRMLGAILGQFVGDALCLGSHWYYGAEKRDAAYPEGIHGFEQPVEGHYHAGREPGDLTHYGEAGLVLLRSVAACGRLDPVDYGRRYVAHFGDPAHEGYLDKPTRGMLENWRAWKEAHPGEEAYAFQDGADDEQNVTTSRLAPVVVRHALDPHLLAVVAACVRVCQNNDVAVGYAQGQANILKALFSGRSLVESFRSAPEGVAKPTATALRRHLDDAQAQLDKSVSEATAAFGPACYLRTTFPAAMHTALKHGNSFEAALLACCRAGGDNASRSGILGAWLGASLGAAAIPGNWLERLRERALIERLAQAVIGGERLAA